MSSSATSSSSFQLVFDAAIVDYLEQTKVDLTNYPLAERLQSCQSADDVLDLLQVKAKQFNDYRDGNRLVDRPSQTTCACPSCILWHSRRCR
jgi:hypothetical protein